MIRSAILVLAMTASAAAQPKPDLKAELAAIFPAKYVGVSTSDTVVHVRVIDGPMVAPPWAELRERARKAHAAVVARSAGAIVVVDYAEAGAMAIAEARPGASAVAVRVGSGAVFQDDAAVYPLSISGRVAFVADEFHRIPGRVKSATCAGKVKNRSAAARRVAVRCIVKRYTTLHEGETLELQGPFARSEVIVDETVQLGTLAPGAEAAFAKPLSAKQWPMLHGTGGELAAISDGAPVAYLDADAYELATDWLAILDKLRADHLGITTRNPYDGLARLGAGMSELSLDLIGDRVEKHDPELLAGRVERAWKMLTAHYTKFRRSFPRTVKLRGLAKSAEISNGKLGPWSDSMF